ncbi:MAG: glycoside hydrolase family 16 protein [Bacteroidota bacterium]
MINSIKTLRANSMINAALLLYCVLLSGTNTSCKKEDSGPIVGPPVVTDSLPSIPGWTLVWNDEFNGTVVDTNKWEYEVNGNGGGNNELQYYTARKENSYIDSGALVIEAKQENYLGKNYTSARMRTIYRGDWKYGRFDIRAKLPFGKGLWPAIWMLPTYWEYGGWPASGEIDIMELLGDNIKKIYGTIHYGETTHLQKGGNYTLPSGNFVETYHLFTVVWDSAGFEWYVDGIKYYSTAMGKPFDKEFHILLNVAVGGNWPGYPDDSTVFPQKMIVDYVRVYKKTN